MYDPVQGAAVHTPKTYGKSLKVSQLPEGIARYFPSNSIKDTALLLAVIDGLMDEVKAIRAALEGIELRMVSSSLLVVWEADEIALREGLQARARQRALDEALAAEEQESEEDEMEDGGDEEDDTPEDSEADGTVSPAYAVKIIDFAHTRLAPGRGRDEGVLFGLDTILRLLRERSVQLSSEAPP